MKISEELRDEVVGHGASIVDWDFGGTRIKGLYCDGTIAVSTRLESSAEENMVLAEELGHHLTCGGVILDQSSVENRKLEARGRVWSYNRLIGLYGLIRAYRHGCRNRYEVAELLEVPEPFVDEAVTYYRNKYGICTIVDNYVVYFDPLGVMELSSVVL